MHLEFICEASKEEEYSELESQVLEEETFQVRCFLHRTDYLSTRDFNHQMGSDWKLRSSDSSSGIDVPQAPTKKRIDMAGCCLTRGSTDRHQGKRCQDGGENQKASPEWNCGQRPQSAIFFASNVEKKRASGVESITPSFEHLQNLTWKDGFCDLLMCRAIFKCARTAGCFQWASGGCGWFMEFHRNPDGFCCQEM